jgi:hypothetical protein
MSATSPRALAQSGDKGWIFIKQLVGSLALWACRQSPTGIPNDLEVVLNKFGAEIAASGRFDANEMAEFGFRELIDYIEPLMLGIPELTKWNLSQHEIGLGFTDADDPKRPIKYSFSSRCDGPKPEYDFIDLDALVRNVASGCVGEAVGERLRENPKPIDMLIFCPNCHKQHIDRPDPEIEELESLRREFELSSLGDRPQSMAAAKLSRLFELESANLWSNPVHKSHTCREDDGGCGTIFRIADVPTNGVAHLRTMSTNDTWHPEGFDASKYTNGGGA